MCFFYIKASGVFSLLPPVGLGGGLTPIMQTLVGTCPRSRIYSVLAVLSPCVCHSGYCVGPPIELSPESQVGQPSHVKLDMT